MKKIEAYQTSDGRLFSEWGRAREHETFLKFIRGCSPAEKGKVSRYTAYETVSSLVQKFPGIADVILSDCIPGDTD